MPGPDSPVVSEHARQVRTIRVPEAAGPSTREGGPAKAAAASGKHAASTASSTEASAAAMVLPAAHARRLLIDQRRDRIEARPGRHRAARKGSVSRPRGVHRAEWAGAARRTAPTAKRVRAERWRHGCPRHAVKVAANHHVVG